MKKIVLAFMLVIGMLNLAFAEKPTLKPYQNGDWSNLVKAANGAPLAVHFWGVTCPSCIKEFPQWGSFLKSHPNAKLVFIQVDDVSTESMQTILTKANLQNANNYYVVAPFDERLRYEIDRKWHGETPTTILIDKNGKATRKTGLTNFQELQAWMVKGS